MNACKWCGASTDESDYCCDDHKRQYEVHLRVQAHRQEIQQNQCTCYEFIGDNDSCPEHGKVEVGQ